MFGAPTTVHGFLIPIPVLLTELFRSPTISTDAQLVQQSHSNFHHALRAQSWSLTPMLPHKIKVWLTAVWLRLVKPGHDNHQLQSSSC